LIARPVPEHDVSRENRHGQDEELASLGGALQLVPSSGQSTVEYLLDENRKIRFYQQKTHRRERRTDIGTAVPSFAVENRLGASV
jgi:hypothetical protein